MLKEDFVIQSNVRRVLARSNIDYSGITFWTVREAVYLRGIFNLTCSHTDGSRESAVDFTIQNLQSLERKIKSILGVIDIEFGLTNWKKGKGQWIPKRLKEGS